MQKGSITVRGVPTMTVEKFLGTAISKLKETGTYPQDFSRKYFAGVFNIAIERVSPLQVYRRIGAPMKQRPGEFMRKFADLYLQDEAMKLFMAYNRKLGMQAIAAKRQELQDMMLGPQWEGVVADPFEEQLAHTEFFIDLDGYSQEFNARNPAEKAEESGQSVIERHFGIPTICASPAEIDNSMFSALGNDLENAYSRGMGDPFGREVEMD